MEKKLGDAWQSRNARVNRALGNVKVLTERRDYKEALEQIDIARKSLPLSDSEKKTLANAEQRTLIQAQLKAGMPLPQPLHVARRLGPQFRENPALGPQIDRQADQGDQGKQCVAAGWYRT